MRATQQTLKMLIVVILMGGMSSIVLASVNHGTFGGGPGEATFVDVTETTATPDDGEPLYESPLFVSTSTLIFRPTMFAADAPGSDNTSALLEMLIEAPEGQWIQTITVRELGDYALLGAGAAAQVSMGLIISADSDGFNVLGTDSNGLTFTVTPPSIGDFGIWDLTVSADVSEAQLSEVYLSLDNTLQALAPDLSLAFIQKKLVRIDVTYVPEPATLGLMALGAVLITRRRH